MIEKINEPSLNHLRPENFNKLEDKPLKSIESLTRFHIDSFDWAIDQGLRHAIKRIAPVEFSLKNGSKVSYKIIDVQILQPKLSESALSTKDKKLYPKECRQRHTTYSGKIYITIEYAHDSKVIDRYERLVGQVPIMVKSKLCNLHKLSPKQMVEKGEEPNDLGGYFIVKGNERLLRLLIMPRRNYVSRLKIIFSLFFL
jgi:DNA-directed RNA polymerase I subunit RPA2